MDLGAILKSKACQSTLINFERIISTFIVLHLYLLLFLYKQGYIFYNLYFPQFHIWWINKSLIAVPRFGLHFHDTRLPDQLDSKLVYLRVTVWSKPMFWYKGAVECRWISTYRFTMMRTIQLKHIEGVGRLRIPRYESLK